MGIDFARAPEAARRAGISIGTVVPSSAAWSRGTADGKVEPAEDDKDSEANADAAEWRLATLN